MSPSDIVPNVGTGTLVPMIGHPVHQTRLPDFFDRAAKAAGRAESMPRIDVPPETLGHFLTEVRHREDVAGFVSTIPHKDRLARLVDSSSQTVELTGVSNSVRREPGGHLHGDMLDGLAMCDALEAAGVDLAGASVVIAGCGAAGRAIALELIHRRASRIQLRDTDHLKSETALTRLTAIGDGPAIELVGPDEGRGWLLVNASPVGMGEDSIPFGPSEMENASCVADAVTAKLTPLLAAAADQGWVTVDGAQMAAAQLGPLRRLLSGDDATESGRGS